MFCIRVLAMKDCAMGVYKRLSLTILTVSLMFGAAGAANPPPMAGLGGQKCGAWTESNASTAIDGIGLLYHQWALGFLSGVVFASPDHWPGGVAVADANHSIDEFCQNNSEATIADAAIAFVRDHQR
jgi:hypothetical protein